MDYQTYILEKNDKKEANKTDKKTDKTQIEEKFNKEIQHSR